MIEPLIPLKGALEIVPVSESTLYHYVSEKKIPFYKIGARVMFRESELATWLENKAVRLTNDYDDGQ